VLKFQKIEAGSNLTLPFLFMKKLAEENQNYLDEKRRTS